MMTFLIDGGHGADDLTKSGKCSPIVTGLGISADPSVYGGRFREGNFNRLVATALAERLRAAGHEALLVTPEREDVSLTERVSRVNRWCRERGASRCVLVSIHANAAGAAEWSPAKGWQSIVDDSGSAKSKALADMLYDAAEAAGLKTRKPMPGRKWYYYRECIGKPARLAMLAKTLCPAVMTENLFYTNRDEVCFLATERGRAKIVDLHFNALMKYAETYSS